MNTTRLWLGNDGEWMTEFGPACGNQWTMGYQAELLNIRCDRLPRHTGKHMNRDHKIEWWGKR